MPQMVYCLSIHGKSILSIVVRTQNNLCKNIPNRKSAIVTYKKGIFVKKEIIKAPIIVIITSIIAKLANR